MRTKAMQKRVVGTKTKTNFWQHLPENHSFNTTTTTVTRSNNRQLSTSSTATPAGDFCLSSFASGVNHNPTIKSGGQEEEGPNPSPQSRHLLMAASPPRSILLLPLILVFADFFPSGASVTAAKPQPICSTANLITAVVGAGGSWCPLWIEPSPAPQVNGEIIDRLLMNGERHSFYSVLFYASWCPFSQNIRPIFDSLASVFPQVQHFVVEEASVMPSILSRYGVHSFPYLILTNGTTRFHYHGSKTKNLPSLVRFYEKSTGLDPINYLVVDETNNQEKMLSRLPAYSLSELMSKEPYMAFSLLFICLKGFFWLFPLLFSHIKAFWASHGRHLNLGFLNESSHMLERVLHGIDIKKLWSKLRLFNKTRNFQKGANNARAWASSLASVSLGESSSSRITNLD